MPVIDFLERNVKLYGNETALVELNPEIKETRRMTWKEYDLIQPTTDEPYRREITWNVFNEKANRFANMLLSRGVKKGDKVITAGGIYGTVKEIKETTLLIEVDGNVTLRIDKNMVVADNSDLQRQ